MDGLPDIFKDKIEIFSTIKVIEETQSPFKKEEITASLDKLKDIFPKWVDVDSTPDILFLASNLVVCDVMNGNHVCLPLSVAKEVYKGFINKLVDIEHDRKRIVGFIINSAFTKVDTDEIIEEKDLDSYDGLVQISYAAAIWRLAAPKLSAFLLKASNPESKEYNQVSSSFELAVSDWDIAVGSPHVKNARIIKRGDKDFDLYAAYLPNNKGSGKTKQGDFVYRVIKGEVLPTGAGLVANPASQVEGIYTLVGEEDIVEKEEGKEKADISVVETPKVESTEVTTANITLPTNEISQQNIENTKIEGKLSVNSNTTHSMKITKVEDIVASLFKEETTASAVTAFIAAEIAKSSEQYVKDLQAQKDLSKKLEEAKASAETKAQELQTKVTELANRLNEIEAQKAAQQAEADFNQRMNAFEEEYDLDEEDRKSLTVDIKACKTKEEFETFVAKIKPLMKEKSKTFKKEKASKLEEAVKAAKATGVSIDTVKVDPKTLDFVEIVASVKETPKQENVPNTPPPAGEKSLVERMQAFKDQISFNGKVVKQ